MTKVEAIAFILTTRLMPGWKVKANSQIDSILVEIFMPYVYGDVERKGERGNTYYKHMREPIYSQGKQAIVKWMADTVTYMVSHEVKEWMTIEDKYAFDVHSTDRGSWLGKE